MQKAQIGSQRCLGVLADTAKGATAVVLGQTRGAMVLALRASHLRSF